MQRAYVGASFEIDDKVNKENFGKLSFGFTSVQNKSEIYNDLPIKYFFSHGTYLYKDIGHNIKMPVEYVEKINVVFREHPGAVKAGNEVFYKSFRRVILEDHEEIQIGKSHRLVFDMNNKKCSININLRVV